MIGRLAGLEGYVTNISAEVMPPAEMLSSYHDLWHVEHPFRMSKTDLQARPMFHPQRDAIEAHLTIVFTALAKASFLQNQNGYSIRKIVRTPRPLQSVTIRLAGQQITAKSKLTDDARIIAEDLGTTQSLGRFNSGQKRSRSVAVKVALGTSSSFGRRAWELPSWKTSTLTRVPKLRQLLYP